MSYKDWANRFSATRTGRWLGSKLAARVDPVLYKLSNGRLTSIGPQVIPQLVLTTIGRKSGRERTVQLAYTKDGADHIIVASNFGKQNHPAWSYNLDAHPEATVKLGARTIRVRAERLSDEEKSAIWSRLVANVPQYGSYVNITDRNIKVYRLRAA